jgi:hypothetical protein
MNAQPAHIKEFITTISADFTNLWPKIKVKYCNYKEKYNETPKLLILSRQKYFTLAALDLKAFFPSRADLLLLSSLDIHLSNRVSGDDFELF